MANNGRTQKLRTAQRKGKIIVATLGPIGMKGEPVIYRPRGVGDNRPWAPASEVFGWVRLNGTECEAREARNVHVNPMTLDQMTAEEKLQFLHSATPFGREYGAELLEEYRQEILREYRGLNERKHRG